jgi:hypothetical protein
MAAVGHSQPFLNTEIVHLARCGSQVKHHRRVLSDAFCLVERLVAQPLT